MRKIIQVAAQGDRLYAVCDDGTAWVLDANGKWHEEPAIPQPPPPAPEEKPAPEAQKTAPAHAEPPRSTTHR